MFAVFLGMAVDTVHLGVAGQHCCTPSSGCHEVEEVVEDEHEEEEEEDHGLKYKCYTIFLATRFTWRGCFYRTFGIAAHHRPRGDIITPPQHRRRQRGGEGGSQS